MSSGDEHIPSASENDVSTGHLTSPVNLRAVWLTVCAQTALEFSLAIAKSEVQ